MAESTKETTAEGAKVTTVATGEPARPADAPVEPETGFPLYAMRMRDFLQAHGLEPHNTWPPRSHRARRLFEPSTAANASTSCRISGSRTPKLTPRGAHLKTMQAIFRMAIAGESIFRSEEDWNAQ